jgi:hypothetical protein
MTAPGLRRLVRPVITKGTWHGLSDFGSYSRVLVILLYSRIAPIVGARPSSKPALLLLLLRLDVFRAAWFADDSIPRIANSLAVSRFLACMYPRRYGPQGHAPERAAVNIIIHVRVRRAAQDSSGPEAAFPLGAMERLPSPCVPASNRGYIA